MIDDRADGEIPKNRLEAPVYNSLAFAMTLLVTGLVIPSLFPRRPRESTV